MFDIGFSELVLVGIVSLIVFGPERLPRVAREAAFWIRKARNAVASVRAEIDHELQLQDLRNSVKLDNLPKRAETWLVEGQPNAETASTEAYSDVHRRADDIAKDNEENAERRADHGPI